VIAGFMVVIFRSGGEVDIFRILSSGGGIRSNTNGERKEEKVKQKSKYEGNKNHITHEPFGNKRNKRDKRHQLEKKGRGVKAEESVWQGTLRKGDTLRNQKSRKIDQSSHNSQPVPITGIKDLRMTKRVKTHPEMSLVNQSKRIERIERANASTDG